MFCFVFSLLTFVVKTILLFSPGQVFFKFICVFLFLHSEYTLLPYPSHPVSTSSVYPLLLHTCSVPLSLFFASLISGPLSPRACHFYDSWAYFPNLLQRRSGNNFKIGIFIGELGWKITPLLTHLI